MDTKCLKDIDIHIPSTCHRQVPLSYWHSRLHWKGALGIVGRQETSWQGTTSSNVSCMESHFSSPLLGLREGHHCSLKGGTLRTGSLFQGRACALSWILSLTGTSKHSWVLALQCLPARPHCKPSEYAPPEWSQVPTAPCVTPLEEWKKSDPFCEHELWEGPMRWVLFGFLGMARWGTCSPGTSCSGTSALQLLMLRRGWS